MDFISFENIETALLDLEKQGDEYIENLFDAFGEEQKVLMAYLMLGEPDTFSHEEEGVLMGLGFEIWYVIGFFQKTKLGMASAESIETQDSENFENLAFLIDLDLEGLVEAWEQIADDHAQGDVLAHILASLLDVFEEEEHFNQAEILVLALQMLKTSLDVLIQE